MRELSLEEIDAVGGGGRVQAVGRFLRWAAGGLGISAAYDAGKSALGEAVDSASDALEKKANEFQYNAINDAYMKQHGRS